MINGRWDPGAAAYAELNWWILRRTVQTNKVATVGAAMARLYALLYGRTNSHIRQAAYLRAKASFLRGTNNSSGQIDWGRVQRLLQRSYYQLKLGINRGRIDNASLIRQGYNTPPLRASDFIGD